MSAIVPWNDPGSASCCCDSCPSGLIDFLSAGWLSYARVDLSPATYSALRSSATIVATITTSFSGTHPLGGAITSWSPFPETVTAMFSFPATPIIIGGYGENRCYVNIITPLRIVTLFNATGGAWNVQTRGVNLTAVLQDAGQGITGVDAPLAFPSMYMNGTAGSMGNFADEAIHRFDNSGTRSGTAFGNTIKFAYSQVGGIGTTIAFNLDVVP